MPSPTNLAKRNSGLSLIICEIIHELQRSVKPLVEKRSISAANHMGLPAGQQLSTRLTPHLSFCRTSDSDCLAEGNTVGLEAGTPVEHGEDQTLGLCSVPPIPSKISKIPITSNY